MADARDDAPLYQTDVALNDVRLDEIARLAALAASYWRSIELAADQGDALTIVIRCEQIASMTLEALALTQLTARAADINDAGLVDAARSLLAPPQTRTE